MKHTCRQCLAVFCSLLLSVGGVEALSFSDFQGRTIAFAAQKGGVLYAMTSNISSSMAGAVEVKLNAEGELVILKGPGSYHLICWEVGGSASNSTFTPYVVSGGEYVPSSNKRLVNNGSNLSIATSSPSGYKQWAFDSSKGTWGFAYSSSETYNILLQADSDGEPVFKSNSYSFTKEPYSFPLAKPYFLAPHTWRTLSSSTYGTIVFDRAVRADEVAGATFFEIDAKLEDASGRFRGIVLRAVEGDLVAGTPYLFRRDAAATYIVAALHGDAVSEATASNGLVGTLAGTEADGGFPVPPGMYVLQGDQLWLTTQTAEGTSQSRLLAGRAYIDPSRIARTVTYAEADEAGTKRLLLVDGQGADGLRSTPATGTPAPLFDLAGRRVGFPARGLVVRRGRKVLLR